MKKGKCIWFKCMLYFASLWLVFLIQFIRLVDLSFYDDLSLKDNIIRIAYNNNWAIIFFILFGLSIVSIKSFFYFIKGSKKPGEKIKKVIKKDYNYLSFFSTIIIPLISYDFSYISNIIVFWLLIIVFGVVTIITDMYYVNPLLCVFGYHIYEISLGNIENVVVISKNVLNIDDFVIIKSIDKNVWVTEAYKIE